MDTAERLMYFPVECSMMHIVARVEVAVVVDIVDYDELLVLGALPGLYYLS